MLTIRKRLRDLEAAELRKKRREEARNGLESYLYSVRDLLESASFAEASKDSERSKIKEVLERTTDWMWSDGDLAPTKDLREKRTDLE
jgi:hypoxia up-regulated 1